LAVIVRCLWRFTTRLPCLPNEMFAQFNEKPIYLWLHLFHRGEI